MMRISFESDSAENAHRGAAAYADAYVAVRQQFLADQQRMAEEQIENRIEELKFLLGSLPPLNPIGGSSEDVTTSIERATLESELLVNQQALAEIRTINTEVATIVDTAQVPSSPSSLSTRTLIFSGAVLGLAIGAAVALLADAVRNRPQPVAAPAPGPAPEPVESVSAAPGPPALHAPAEAPSSGPPSTGTGDLPSPGSGETERQLQAVLDQIARASASLMPAIHRRVVSGGEALLVVDDDEQSSATAALALSMEVSRRGARTLLVEAVQVEPTLADIGGLVGATSPLGEPSSGGRPYRGVENLSVLTIADGIDVDRVASRFPEFAADHDAVILIAGRASQSALLRAELPAGAAVVATRAPANPANLPSEDLAAIEQSAHQLIGILSIGEHPLPG